jgi:hypothetical protein
MNVVRRSRPWTISALIAVLCLLVLAGPAAARGRGPDAVGAAGVIPAAPPPPGITVQGSHLMQNGLPFVARGVQIVGLVAPNASLAGKYIAANQHFGAAELAQAVADHANLIRFQVSEFGLNPADPLYDPSYAAEVQQGVAMARADGLNVIVSLQAESPAGNETRCPLPDAGAATDWHELATMFASDPGTMFELYNEPGLSATPNNWQDWADGGTVFNGRGPCQAVGMQSLIDEIRTAGADNVIILPGLAGETTFAGMPTLSDPANPSDPQLAYGVHYPDLTQESSEWDSEFGDISGRLPVIVTEWQANAFTNCIADAPRTAPLLLAYLALHQIGVVGFAFDLPGTIVADYSYAPTTYDNFSCGPNNVGGPGQILFDDYAGEAAQATATAGAGSPASWLLGVGAVGQMETLDAASTQRALDTPRTFVTGTSDDQLSSLGLGAATPAETYTDETALAQAAASGVLRAGTRAVVLQLGPRSPANQQRNPERTFELGAQAAHRNGLLFVAEPQIGMLKTLAPKSKPRNWNITFLRRELPQAAARTSDAVVLPFGNAQKRSAGYAAISQIAAWQINAVRPGIPIIGALNVSGSNTPSGATLAATTRAAAGVVTGFALSGQPSAANVSPVNLLQTLYGVAG